LIDVLKYRKFKATAILPLRR